MARRKGKTKWLCLGCFQAAKPQPRGKPLVGLDTKGRCRRTADCRAMKKTACVGWVVNDEVATR